MIAYHEIAPYSSPSPLRISTMTMLFELNRPIELERCFENARVIESSQEEGILSAKIFKKVENSKEIEFRLKSTHGLETSFVRSCFQNQMTLTVQFLTLKETMQKVSLFIFNKGKVKMAGLKSNEDIPRFADFMIRLFNKMSFSEMTLEVSTQRTVMYNSDFQVNFRILRNSLFELIVTQYNLTNSSYDPERYPGVKVKYAWNSRNRNQGVCNCIKSCKGKGTGNGDGECKVGTISVFQTGKIIITGANSFEQVLSMYEFINEIIKKHYHELFFREPILIESGVR
jgi:TATA-box binding protein (TBP) (component of TFIID and TFIIIB)